MARDLYPTIVLLTSGYVTIKGDGIELFLSLKSVRTPSASFCWDCLALLVKAQVGSMSTLPLPWPLQIHGAYTLVSLVLICSGVKGQPKAAVSTYLATKALNGPSLIPRWHGLKANSNPQPTLDFLPKGEIPWDSQLQRTYWKTPLRPLTGLGL